MAARTVLVTGANRGIGFATASGLARLGWRVLAVARDRAAGEAAVAEIARGTGAAVELLQADLSSQRSVRALAGSVLARCGRLDVLVNNAGVVTRRRCETEDGIETQLAVNHLAPFLLTNLLLDLLRASAPARVVTVSSDTHFGAELDFDDLQMRRRYRPAEQYARTKLANVLFTYELARRLEGTGVTANALHPGVVSTKLLADYMGAPASDAGPARGGPSLERGAETSVHLASSPEVEGVTGRYFVARRPRKSSPASYREEDQRRLWAASAELVGLPT